MFRNSSQMEGKPILVHTWKSGRGAEFLCSYSLIFSFSQLSVLLCSLHWLSRSCSQLITHPNLHSMHFTTSEGLIPGRWNKPESSRDNTQGLESFCGPKPFCSWGECCLSGILKTDFLEHVRGVGLQYSCFKIHVCVLITFKGCHT